MVPGARDALQPAGGFRVEVCGRSNASSILSWTMRTDVDNATKPADSCRTAPTCCTHLPTLPPAPALAQLEAQVASEELSLERKEPLVGARR